MANTTDTLTASEVKKINSEMDKLLIRLTAVQKSISGISKAMTLNVSNIEVAIDDIGRALHFVAESLRTTKSEVLGIDELNIIESKHKSTEEDKTFASFESQGLNNNLYYVEKHKIMWEDCFNELEERAQRLTDLTFEKLFSIESLMDHMNINIDSNIKVEIETSFIKMFMEMQKEWSVGFNRIEKNIIVFQNKLAVQIKELMKTIFLSISKSVSSKSKKSNQDNTVKAETKKDWADVIIEKFKDQLNDEIEDIYEDFIEEKLGESPILNVISAGVESLFGNSAAKSALTFMLEPFLSTFAIPITGVVTTAKYNWEIAKETADLTEKIDELGEEEGRIAAGTGLWDKAALYQYDTQKADFNVLYAGLYGKEKDAETVDEDWLSSMFSEERLQEVTERLKKWFEDEVAPWFTVEKWLELISNIKIAVEQKWNEFTTWFSETAFGKWINEDVLPWFTVEKWLELVGNIKLAAEELWESFITWFNNTAFGKWLNEKVIPFFDEENWNEMLEGIEKALIETFTKGVNGAVAVLNDFINWVNEKLRIEWDALYFNGEKIFDKGAFQLFTIPNIPTFSAGGFPEDGLFMANHGELVGKFTDGRTVVANNEQIVSGIKLGVKEAVCEVLEPYLVDIVQNTRETADKEFSTYIGDKEIARASERGKRAMGVQLIK